MTNEESCSILKKENREDDHNIQYDENLLDNYMENLSLNYQQIKLIFIIGLYLVGEGFVMITNTLIIPVIAKPWKISEFEKGLLGGSIFLGFTLGSPIAGLISDNKGRRLAFCIGCSISLVGGLVGVVFLQNYLHLFISNFLVGLGIGIGIPSIFTLCSEINNTHWRSIIIGGIWFTFVIGQLISCYIAKTYEIYSYSNNSWRILLFCRCITVNFNFTNC